MGIFIEKINFNADLSFFFKVSAFLLPEMRECRLENIPALNLPNLTYEEFKTSNELTKFLLFNKSSFQINMPQ